MHDRTQIEHCSNSSIATHILEAEVFRLIGEKMIDPVKLRGCMKGRAEVADDRSTARELSHVARKIAALEHERRQLIDQYAADKMSGEDYIKANRALDCELERLIREKARLAAALRSPNHEDFVDASVRQFCAAAKARWYGCTDDETRRQFLLDFVEGGQGGVGRLGTNTDRHRIGHASLPHQGRDQQGRGAQGAIRKPALAHQTRQRDANLLF